MPKFINESIIKSGIIVILCVLLCYISKKIIKRLLSFKTSKIPKKRQKTVINLISNIVRVFIIFIGFTIILEEYGVDTKSFIASLGVFSLVLGLALQDLLKDIISGISIAFEGLFNIGDYIEIGGFRGEVVANGLRTTKIKAYTGEIKIVSNRNILELINYSMDKTLTTVDIGVDYQSDLDIVEKVLNNICIDLKKEQVIKDVDLLGLERIDDSGLIYRLAIKSSYQDSFILSRILKRKIIDSFNDNNIVIPYSQVVVHNAKL